MSQSIRFREIDLDRDAETCIRFRADSFVESFGSAERFFRAAGDGASDYLQGLRSKNREWPGSCVHAWLDDTIAGQIELRRERGDPSRAHVLLYYLRSDFRGRGLGEQLDAYVRAMCRAAGVQTTTLRVSAENRRAIAFYRKHGWHDRGPDPDHPDVRIMERADGQSEPLAPPPNDR
jgi:ribosomal protein S18 acetylase RimI-like enzyme